MCGENQNRGVGCFCRADAAFEAGRCSGTIFQHPFNQGSLAVRYLYEYLVEGRRFERNVLLMPQRTVKRNIDYISN
jgi:hypothetical protein